MAKTRPGPNGCIDWTGNKNKRGYGKFTLYLTGGIPQYFRAHRYAYILVNGPIPEGLEIDHLCKRPSCVNPAHLEAVTPKVNVQRSRTPQLTAARNKARSQAQTHCAHGHEYTPENTLRFPSQTGRRCRTCRDAKRAPSSV